MLEIPGVVGRPVGERLRRLLDRRQLGRVRLADEDEPRGTKAPGELGIVSSQR